MRINIKEYIRENIDLPSEEVREMWWKYYISQKPYPKTVTEKRLGQMKKVLWEDKEFWFFTIFRFGLEAYDQVEDIFTGKYAQLAAPRYAVAQGLAAFHSIMVEKISNKEHLNPNNIPYLKPSTDKKPTKVGRFRI